MSEQGAQSGQDSDLRAELSLRPERPPVMRLSRKVLMGLATIAAITVSGALIWALYQGRDRPGTGGELYNTENKTTPDGLSTLPRDYTGIPRAAPPLGPPLPGDLGRPMLNAQVPVPGPGATPADPEQQRVAQAYVAQLDKAGVYKRKVVTQINPLADFYAAEGYHQDYATLHPDHLAAWDERQSG